MKYLSYIVSFVLLVLCLLLICLSIFLYKDSVESEYYEQEAINAYIAYKDLLDGYIVGRNITEVKLELRKRYPHLIDKGDDGEKWYLLYLAIHYDSSGLVTEIERYDRNGI